MQHVYKKNINISHLKYKRKASKVSPTNKIKSMIKIIELRIVLLCLKGTSFVCNRFELFSSIILFYDPFMRLVFLALINYVFYKVMLEFLQLL